MIHRTWRRMKTGDMGWAVGATTILSVADCRGRRSPGLLCGRRRAITRTCVRVLHQAEDHTRLPIDIEAQGVLFLGHVDDEVGVSIHWGHRMECIRWGTGQIRWGRPGPRVPLRTHPQSLGWATAGRWSWAESERAARPRAQKLAGEKDRHLEGRGLGPRALDARGVCKQQLAQCVGWLPVCLLPRGPGGAGGLGWGSLAHVRAAILRVPRGRRRKEALGCHFLIRQVDDKLEASLRPQCAA